MFISLNLVDSKVSCLLFSLSIVFFHMISCSQAYSYAHETEENLTSLMPVSQNHPNGWHSAFAFFIELLLTWPNSLVSFLLSSPCPTEKGTWWEAGWVLSGINPPCLQNPKFEKEVQHKSGHCCAGHDMVSLLKEFCNCWIQWDGKLLVFICQWMRKHWFSFQISILADSFKKDLDFPMKKF